MAANRIRSMFPVAPRKGETFELRTGLNSQFAHERLAGDFFFFLSQSLAQQFAKMTCSQEGCDQEYYRCYDIRERCVRSISGHYQKYGEALITSHESVLLTPRLGYWRSRSEKARLPLPNVRFPSPSSLPTLGILTSYARNYAKTHPDLCILAVNTFVQVCRPTGLALNGPNF